VQVPKDRNIVLRLYLHCGKSMLGYELK